MNNPFHKPRTVQSVYDVFVKDLTAVKEAQQAQADRAQEEQKVLENKLQKAKSAQEVADTEVRMADTAIAGIRDMLGMGTSKTEEPVVEESTEECPQ